MTVPARLLREGRYVPPGGTAPSARVCLPASCSAARPGAAGTGRAAVVAALAAGLLAGCASLSTRPPGEGGDVLAGRLSVRVEAVEGRSPARSLSAGFELAGSPEAGRLELSTPFGTLLARARWMPGGALLTTPDGERAYPDRDTLVCDLLGEELPLGALFDWLRGRPWPQVQSTPLDEAQGLGFMQLGWRVDLARRAEGVVVATRAQPPAVRVQVKLDREPQAAATAAPATAAPAAATSPQ